MLLSFLALTTRDKLIKNSRLLKNDQNKYLQQLSKVQVNNAFEFDSNPSEDRQQIHWRSSEAGGEFVGGLPNAADKKSCSLRPSDDRQQIH